MNPRGTTTQRGYGTQHDKQRARWQPIVNTGQVECWRCGKLIRAGQPWHLGHNDHDRSRYNGPEHAKCNIRAANYRMAGKTKEPAPALKGFFAAR